MRRSFFRIVQTGLVFLSIAVLGACVRPAATTRVAVDKTVAQAVWDRFTTAAARAKNISGPFQINATLYYSGKEDSQRVSMYFWGNGRADAPHPLRLDILMGPGSIIAQMREGAHGIFIYVPRENTVFQAEDRGLLGFGVPIPFALADIAYLLNGTFAGVFAPVGQPLPLVAPEATLDEDGSITYSINNSTLAGQLTLSPEGLPVNWREDGNNGWNLTVDYWSDSTRQTPRKLHVKHPEGGEATLIVRELNHPKKEFTPAQLDMAVPHNTRLARLDVAR